MPIRVGHMDWQSVWAIFTENNDNQKNEKRNEEEQKCNHEQQQAATTIPEEEPQSSEASSSFPIIGHSHLDPIKDHIMAEEPRRVTLEDYSSSNVP